MSREVSPKAILIENDGVKYIQFENFLKYKNVLTHCFSTRIGGVSEGECSTLNLGFNRKDKKENVFENYKRISKCLGIDSSNMVFSNQIHDCKLKIVDERDRGKGMYKQSDIIGYDGLITNKGEVSIVTLYADCVPVFFFDPDHRVIAISHSGWRGTLKEIAKITIEKMTYEFGSQPDLLETAIGPSICEDCFEVGEEVYIEFINKLGWSNKFCKKSYTEGKWLINLQGIIKQTLVNSGIKNENICNSQMCTKCNKEIFFSHRGDIGKTGSLAAIMQLLRQS